MTTRREITPALTLEEAATKYALTPRALREFCKRHRIEVLNTGSQIRFDEHAINHLEEVMRAPRGVPAASQLITDQRWPTDAEYERRFGMPRRKADPKAFAETQRRLSGGSARPGRPGGQMARSPTQGSMKR